MGKTYTSLPDHIREFIQRQKLFFVATAPLTEHGHVNCSPKGFDTFRILDDATVGYLDLTGSGAETIAHLRENGRMVILFCAFDGPPLIVRLYGKGRVVQPDHPEFASLARSFPEHGGTRSIILLEISRVTDSCGYGVPLYDYREERPQYPSWLSKKEGSDGLAAYQREKNATSMDGLPALETGG